MAKTIGKVAGSLCSFSLNAEIECSHPAEIIAMLAEIQILTSAYSDAIIVDNIDNNTLLTIADNDKTGYKSSCVLISDKARKPSSMWSRIAWDAKSGLPLTIALVMI